MSKRNIIQHYRGQGIPDDLSAGEFAIDISNTGAPILLVSDDGTGVQSLTMFRGNEEPTEEAYQSQLWLDTSVTGGGVDSTYLVANNLTTAYSGTYVLDAYQGKLLNDSLSAVVTEIQDIWETIYPVGSIYMSVNSASPETLFGGTWEQIKDRFLLGAGDTYTAGATGGSADAVVVSHSHNRICYVGNTGWTVGDAIGYGGSQTDNNSVRLATGVSVTSQPISHFATNSAGVSGTGKNMPPYLTVYMWKRIA